MAIIVLFTLTTIAACSNESSKLDSESWSDTQKAELLVNEKSCLMYDFPQADVKFYCNKHIDFTLSEFVLTIGDRGKVFDWELQRLPDLELIKKENKTQVLISVSHTDGPGVFRQELHLINTKDFSEIDIQDPLEIIRDRVDFEIESDNIILKFNNGTHIVDFSALDMGEVEIPNKGLYGDVVFFQYLGDEIRCFVDLYVNGSGFCGESIGHFKVNYEVTDNQIVFKDLTYCADSQ